MTTLDGGGGVMSEAHMGAVIRNSDEWAFVEYMLQINTRTSRRRLVVYSFVDASLLDDDNSIQDVARRGFKIGPRGMKFVLGNFRKQERSDFMEAAKTQLLSGERRVFEFYLCKVGVGHSAVMSDEREASGERTTLPPEYDSAYLQKGDAAPTETLTVFFDNPEQYLTEGAASIRKAEAARQVNKGLSMATAGVVPNYLVLFEVDPTEPELFAVPLQVRSRRY
ncbi:hypothetical protein ACSSS7_002332 [Eimeria intestinalis]